jgi:folylpolyglutamate synthase/dihydropteroate synthase
VLVLFDYFSKEKVDIAIIEVEWKARRNKHYHTTVSVITNIGLDHTQVLEIHLKLLPMRKGRN